MTDKDKKYDPNEKFGGTVDKETLKLAMKYVKDKQKEKKNVDRDK